MITKEQFIKITDLIQDLEERDHNLNEALQDYTEDKDFTGFFSHTPDKILNILADLMNDTENTISWWFYDCPEMGKNPDNCNIYDHDGKVIATILTKEQLYDYIVLEQGTLEAREKYNLAFKQQTEGVKFAIGEIDNLRQTNKSTGNDGWEERDTLLKLIRDKIINEYMLQSGATLDLTDPISDYGIITNLENYNES